MWPFSRRQHLDDVLEMYNLAIRSIRVVLYSDLKATYLKSMDSEVAGVLAAQVVNFLTGEEAKKEDEFQESIRSSFPKIQDQIQQKAMEKMKADDFTREIIVSTLRMKIVFQFAINGESYLVSPEKIRIEDILKEFGSEFPNEVVPEEYFKLAHKYHQERFKE